MTAEIEELNRAVGVPAKLARDIVKKRDHTAGVRVETVGIKAVHRCNASGCTHLYSANPHCAWINAAYAVLQFEAFQEAKASNPDPKIWSQDIPSEYGWYYWLPCAGAAWIPVKVEEKHIKISGKMYPWPIYLVKYWSTAYFGPLITLNGA